MTPLDDLHAKEIDSFFAGDPAADSLDVILMRAEVRTESHLKVGREEEEPLVKEEQEEEAEVVKDEEEEQQARADAARLLSDEELAEALQAAEEAQAAERAKKRERRQAEKAERDDHISEALRIAGWQCPNCYEWNLSFRQLCFRCSTPLRLAEVVSRGIPDPRRAPKAARMSWSTRSFWPTARWTRKPSSLFLEVNTRRGAARGVAKRRRTGRAATRGVLGQTPVARARASRKAEASPMPRASPRGGASTPGALSPRALLPRSNPAQAQAGSQLSRAGRPGRRQVFRFRRGPPFSWVAGSSIG